MSHFFHDSRIGNLALKAEAMAWIVTALAGGGRFKKKTLDIVADSHPVRVVLAKYVISQGDKMSGGTSYTIKIHGLSDYPRGINLTLATDENMIRAIESGAPITDDLKTGRVIMVSERDEDNRPLPLFDIKHGGNPETVTKVFDPVFNELLTTPASFRTPT